MEGRATNTWSSYKASFPDPRSKLNVLVQIGLRREADLPDIPLLSDLVKGDADKEKEKVARLVSESLAVARPFSAPPGVPEDRVAILRLGFEGALADPALIAEAAKLRLDLSPMTGSEVQAIIKNALGTDQQTKDLVAKLFR